MVAGHGRGYAVPQQKVAGSGIGSSAQRSWRGEILFLPVAGMALYFWSRERSGAIAILARSAPGTWVVGVVGPSSIGRATLNDGIK